MYCRITLKIAAALMLITALLTTLFAQQGWWIGWFERTLCIVAVWAIAASTIENLPAERVFEIGGWLLLITGFAGSFAWIFSSRPAGSVLILAILAFIAGGVSIHYYDRVVAREPAL